MTPPPTVSMLSIPLYLLPRADGEEHRFAGAAGGQVKT